MSSSAWPTFKRAIKPYTPELLLDCYRGIRRFLNVNPYEDVARDSSRPLPVLVYQMGKVGSRSVIEALNMVPGLKAMHVHRIGTDIHPNLNKRVSARNEPVKIISMIRDPITRNLSSYFHLLDNHFNTRDAHFHFSNDEIGAHFFEYIETDVEDAVGWFDNEFRVMTGIDVYQHHFPTEQKWTRIIEDPFEVLILRVDMTDEDKAAVIADFLGIDELVLTRSNVGKSRANGAEYKQFVSTIRLPPEYLDKNLGSSFTRHFFSPAEIEAMYDRWYHRGVAVEHADG